MPRSGIRHPDVVDLISQEKDGTIRLILAEVEALTGDHVLALQQNLENYLSFAVEGQLAASTPSARGCPVRIRVDLYARPDGLVIESLRCFRVLALRKGVDFEASVNQETLAL
jgi:hypothetical protein